MHDIVIRNGTVIDGTGAPGARADVAIDGDRVVAVGDVGSGRQTIDADGCVVTPGFVDIHSHLDAQLHWDPLASPASLHGVTSVVMGNCGITFAPCRPSDREYLAGLMESVEDIPKATIIDGLDFNWESFGEFLTALDKLPLGINAGGFVGHSALRIHAMGERGLKQHVADLDDVERMCALVDEAMAGGALGFSTSRVLGHVTPEGESIPGTFADEAELFAYARVLAKHGRGVYQVLPRLDDQPAMPSEIEWMARLSAEFGRPVTFGYPETLEAHPDAWRATLAQVREANAAGSRVYPQTQVRSVGLLFGLLNNMPPFGGPDGAWAELRKAPTLAARLELARKPEFRARLVADGESNSPFPAMLIRELYLLEERDGEQRYDFAPEDSIDAIAAKRGISRVEAFLDAMLESEGQALFLCPIANTNLETVGRMLSDENVLLGLADSGAHVGQIMDSSLPSFLLSYWVREQQLFPAEEAVRKLTSEPARLFGLRDRGELRPGAFADVNVIDLDALRLQRPDFVYDFPLGAGRFTQRAIGMRHTLVNGQPFMEDGEHTGAHAGRVLRSSD